MTNDTISTTLAQTLHDDQKASDQPETPPLSSTIEGPAGNRGAFALSGSR